MHTKEPAMTESMHNVLLNLTAMAQFLITWIGDLVTGPEGGSA